MLIEFVGVGTLAGLWTQDTTRILGVTGRLQTFVDAGGGVGGAFFGLFRTYKLKVTLRGIGAAFLAF